MHRYDTEYDRGHQEPWERSRYNRREQEGRRFDQYRPENYEGGEYGRGEYGRGYEAGRRYESERQGSWGQPYANEYPSQDWERQYGREPYGQQGWQSYGRQPGQYLSGPYGRGQYGMQYGEYGGGRYYGRGPKGYQPSDQRILEEINERLTEHVDIDASEIEVKVQSGEVTLTGTVNERYAKRLAEDVAENVLGVKQLHNQIRVQPETSWRESGTGSMAARKSATSDAGQQHAMTATGKR